MLTSRFRLEESAVVVGVVGTQVWYSGYTIVDGAGAPVGSAEGTGAAKYSLGIGAAAIRCIRSDAAGGKGIRCRRCRP